MPVLSVDLRFFAGSALASDAAGRLQGFARDDVSCDVSREVGSSSLSHSMLVKLLFSCESLRLLSSDAGINEIKILIFCLIRN